MSALLQARPMVVFYTLALLIVCAVIVNALAAMSADADAAAAFTNLVGDIVNAGGYVSIPWIAYFAREQPILLGIFVFAGAPSIAAVLAALACKRLKRLGAMLRLWNGVSWRRGILVYGAILIAYAAMLGVFSWMTWLDGGDAALNAAWSALGTVAAGAAMPGALIALVLDEGGTLEELGWRGFAQDRLSEQLAPLAVAITLGVLWWAWHLPREAATILSGAPWLSFVWGQGVFLLLCIALSIVISLAWNSVGGSIWVGVLIHGGTNVCSKALGEGAWSVFGGWMESVHPLLRTFDLRTVIVLVLAVVILALAGPRLGRAHELAS